MKDDDFWEGFNAAIDMVLAYLDNCVPDALAIDMRDEILDEVEIYKKDG